MAKTSPLRDLVRLDVVVDPTWDQNCYVLQRRDTDAALVIDPGFQHRRVLEVLERGGMRCERIVVTHGHGDHINGVPFVRAAHGCPAAMHAADMELVPMFRMLPGVPADSPDVDFDQQLSDGEMIRWQGLDIEVIHTPGHTQGSVCFVVHLTDDHPDLIAGDTLFNRGVGRTDLPGGNWEQLVFSVQNRLYALPAETVVHPGHGPRTTIGEEMSGNPFVVHPRYR